MESIIKKFDQIHKEIKLEKGDFYLFMLLKMDEYTDKWSVLISAPWISANDQKPFFEYVADKIVNSLTKDEVSELARIGIFRPDEHLVSLITQTIHVEGNSPTYLQDTRVNGYTIHECYIFESQAIKKNEI